jgi:hypothetical protein
MMTRMLATEMREAFARLTRADAETLANLSIPPIFVMNWQLVGKALVRRIGTDLYEPDPNGRTAFITPVLAHRPHTPESPDPKLAVRCGNLIDLLAWHPACPGRWRLRLALATWLGAIEPQYCGPLPVPVWRTPLRWLQADGAGLCLLSCDRLENQWILSACIGGIIPEDELHERQIKRLLERPWPTPKVHRAA